MSGSLTHRSGPGRRKLLTNGRSTTHSRMPRNSPNFLLTSCEGSSAHKKESRNTVWPKLKSAGSPENGAARPANHDALPTQEATQGLFIYISFFFINIFKK